MNKANQNQKNRQPRQVTLYRNVFYSRVSTAVVLCLCLSFLLQPIERIYAFEETKNTSSPVDTMNLAVDAGLETTPVIESPSAEPVAIEAASEDASSNNETDQGTVPTTTTSAATSTIDDSVDVAGDTGTTTVFTDEEIQDLIDAEGAAIDAESEETTATSTATSSENSVAVSTVYSDAVMQFSKSDCVTVEGGSFYCQTKQAQEEQGTDGMYALQDKDGDLEIFVQKNGELTQITFNTVDDAAPFFDSTSNTIVWHRLIDDRYQIISYDLNSGVEVQLTAETVNNMEPSRSGTYTVWQRWNNDNWDVVLYDGSEIKYISDSSFHDIAPNIKGNLVMWNRLTSENVQTIELYDIVTKEYTTISDTEGGAVSNPRMVLVYETEFANGDIVTKGYDVDTGEITPLESKPAELPAELPEPDATGETRALLQPKNPTKDDAESSEGTVPETASSTPPVPEGVLIVGSSSPATAGSSVITASSSTPTLDMTLDIVVPPVPSHESSMTLIVPAFSDSQPTELVESTL